jgi:hypothetical protein
LANPRGGWHYHAEDEKDPLTRIHTLAVVPQFFVSLAPPHKPPSKERHDRERSIKRDRIFQQRREERLRLFGYVLLKNGEILSIDDAMARLRDGLRAEENPNIVDGISKDDIAEWHSPESYRDVIDSLGEIDVPRGVTYPALGLGEGTVLLDPKLRDMHRDPALRR